MNHEQAVNEALQQRYLMGELTPAERDEFEEHFADCSRCLEDLRLYQTFAANAQAVFRDQEKAAAIPHQVRPPWWRRPRLFAVSGGLSVALAAAALYVFVAVIPRLQTEVDTLEAPTISETFALHGVTRGIGSQPLLLQRQLREDASSGPVYTVASNTAPTFRLDLPRHFERYVCAVESTANHSRKTYTLQVPANTETLNLTIPLAGLPPGDYKVALSGYQGTQSEVLSTFVLRVKPVT